MPSPQPFPLPLPSPEDLLESPMNARVLHMPTTRSTKLLPPLMHHRSRTPSSSPPPTLAPTSRATPPTAPSPAPSPSPRRHQLSTRADPSRPSFPECVFPSIFCALSSTRLPSRALHLFDQMLPVYRCRPFIRSLTSALSAMSFSGPSRPLAAVIPLGHEEDPGGVAELSHFQPVAQGGVRVFAGTTRWPYSVRCRRGG